jgi:hypothetical protein
LIGANSVNTPGPLALRLRASRFSAPKKLEPPIEISGGIPIVRSFLKLK